MMQLNITHTNSFQFEDRDYLKNHARNLLQNKNDTLDNVEKIIDKTIFNDLGSKQATFINASAPISYSENLKETLKYLKNHARKAEKKHVLGEIWESFDYSEQEPTELFSLVFDDKENIFAA